MINFVFVIVCVCEEDGYLSSQLRGSTLTLLGKNITQGLTCCFSSAGAAAQLLRGKQVTYTLTHTSFSVTHFAIFVFDRAMLARHFWWFS